MDSVDLLDLGRAARDNPALAARVRAWMVAEAGQAGKAARLTGEVAQDARYALRTARAPRSDHDLLDAYKRVERALPSVAEAPAVWNALWAIALACTPKITPCILVSFIEHVARVHGCGHAEVRARLGCALKEPA
jgi:hypothetical protein